MELDKKVQDQKAANSANDILATLAEALTHDDAAVRASAIQEIANRKEKRAVSLLVECLTDDADTVRFQAATALNALGWRAGEPELQAKHAVALHDFQRAASLGEVAIDSLAPLVSDENEGMRMVAVETLAQIGGARCLEPLCKALEDENWHLRAVAAQALARVADPGALQALSKLVRDSSYEVRSVVLDALESINVPECASIIVKFLKDEAADIRHRAAELLGNFSDKKLICPLIAAAVDINAAVRDAALQTLAKLDKNWSRSDYAKQSTSGLLHALKHEEDGVRKAAADILRTIGQTPAMNSFLTADIGAMPQNPATVLAQGLQSGNRDLRQASAEALGKLGERSAIPQLVSALWDEDQYVRDAALYALNLLHWKPANDAEIALRAVVLQQWDTAVLFEKLSVEPLVMMLEAEDANAVKGAVETLGKIGDKRSEDALAVMLRHWNKGVRAAAASALRMMGWQPAEPQDFVIMAIELGDWETVKMQGEMAIAPLITQIKENYHQAEFAEGALAALAGMSDPRAVRTLLSYTRDGQIAETVMLALENIIQKAADGVDAADLQTLATLNNLVQFRYSFDPKYGTYVRSGLQEVDSSMLKKMAGQELARRS